MVDSMDHFFVHYRVVLKEYEFFLSSKNHVDLSIQF